MIDTHTHTEHSFDSKQSAAELAQVAYDKGCRYLAITNHFDRDIVGLPEMADIPQLDIDKTYRDLDALRTQWQGRMRIGVGLECGWAPQCENDYAPVIDSRDWDFVIQSVHMVDNEDIYLPSYFATRTRKQAYGRYLECVRMSLDAPYRFDAIGHIGYVIRKSTYQDNAMVYAEHADLLDDILRTIIAKGKALEINSNGKGTPEDFLPNRAILRRYRELGGELLTFGSDAHTADRVCDKYAAAAQLALSMGFRYFFGYEQHKPIAFPLETR